MFKLICLKLKKEFYLNDVDPLILGRGAEVECFDKRVSRKHAELSLSGGEGVTLTALHTNPCFIMQDGVPPVIIIRKNEKKLLKPGDCLSLLPDTSWFYLVQTNSVLPDECVDADPPSPCFFYKNPSGSEASNVPNGLSSSGDFQLKTTPTKTIYTVSNNSTPEPPKNCEESSNAHVKDCELTSISRQSLSLTPDIENRSNDCDTPSDVGSLSPKSDYDFSSSTLNKETSSLNKEESVVKRPSLVLPYSPRFVQSHEQTLLVPSNSVSDSSPSVGSAKKTQKTRRLPLWMYDIDGDVPTPKRSAHGGDPQHKDNSSIKQEETTQSEQDDSSTRTKPSPSPISTTQPQSAPQSSRDAVSPASDQCDIKKEPDKRLPDSELSNEPSAQNVVKTESETSTTTSDGATSASGRPLCQYEASCYRRNSEHRDEFSHPGDADWIPVELRPVCPFGSACYRRNPSHRVAFNHPRPVRTARRSPSPRSSPFTTENEDSDDPYQTDGDSDWSPTKNKSKNFDE